MYNSLRYISILFGILFILVSCGSMEKGSVKSTMSGAYNGKGENENEAKKSRNHYIRERLGKSR